MDNNRALAERIVLKLKSGPRAGWVQSLDDGCVGVPQIWSRIQDRASFAFDELTRRLCDDLIVESDDASASKSKKKRNKNKVHPQRARVMALEEYELVLEIAPTEEDLRAMLKGVSNGNTVRDRSIGRGAEWGRALQDALHPVVEAAPPENETKYQREKRIHNNRLRREVAERLRQFRGQERSSANVSDLDRKRMADIIAQCQEDTTAAPWCGESNLCETTRRPDESDVQYKIRQNKMAADRRRDRDMYLKKLETRGFAALIDEIVPAKPKRKSTKSQDKPNEEKASGDTTQSGGKQPARRKKTKGRRSSG